MIDVTPLFGIGDAPNSECLAFRVFPRSGAERWMIEASQQRPWHLKTWPRVSLRARMIYRATWALSGFGLQLPHRLETFTVSQTSPYSKLRAEFDRLGIFLGTPGPNRKIVVYAANADRSVFIKIPLGCESAALVSREADALKLLALDPQLAALIPEASTIAGHLAVENVEQNGVIHAALSIIEVARIHSILERRSATVRTIGSLRSEWSVPLEGVHAVHDGTTRALLERARRVAIACFKDLPEDKAVHCYMAHGDLTRWNVLRAADGSARIIDWELFGLKPRWFDLIHYVVSSHLLVKRTPATVVIRDLHEVAQRIRANALEDSWWTYVRLYFIYQSLYYVSIYSRQTILHKQAQWQLDAWANILSIMQAQIEI